MQATQYDPRVRYQIVIVILSAIAAAQVTPRPNFTDYPAKELYPGKAAAPKLTRDQRTFRTQIRDGAKSSVEFAGHYTLPRWGCGTGCMSFVVMDSVSGRVYDAPFGIVSDLAWAGRPGEEPELIEFKPHRVQAE